MRAAAGEPRHDMMHGLAHTCARKQPGCAEISAFSKIDSSKDKAFECMQRAKHSRQRKESATGTARKDVGSAGHVQFARAGPRALNRKSLSHRRGRGETGDSWVD